MFRIKSLFQNFPFLLLKKILYIFLMLIVYRIGTYIPLPFINFLILDDISKHSNNSFFNIFDIFTGGALCRMSIFSLNIMPYITSSIIIQLFLFLLRSLNYSESSFPTKNKILLYSQYLSLFISFFQGYGISLSLESIEHQGTRLVNNNKSFFLLVSTATLVVGSLIVTWISNQIGLVGLGNGSSFIILSGIVSGIFPALFSLIDMFNNNTISHSLIIIYFFEIFFSIFFVVFFENSQRKLFVRYPCNYINYSNSYNFTYLPIKLNISGVLSMIFTNTMLIFPSTVISFFTYLGFQKNFFFDFSSYYFSQGSFLYFLFYMFFIVFFCFFYNVTILNPEQVAINLRKNNIIVVGKCPGLKTKKYIKSILLKITFIGSLYILFICVTPEILKFKYNIPIYLSGATIIIITSIMIDITTKIYSYLLGYKYIFMFNYLDLK